VIVTFGKFRKSRRIKMTPGLDDDYSGATHKFMARKPVAPFWGAHGCALDPITGMPAERRQSKIDLSPGCVIGRGPPDPAQASTEGPHAVHPSIQG
jgi:hypothetical protein